MTATPDDVPPTDASRSLGPAQVAAALLSAAMVVPVAVSLATLLFAPVGPEAIGPGTGFLIASGLVTVLVVGLRSTIPGTVAMVQDLPAAVLAGVAATLAASTGAAAFASVTAVLVLTTALTAVTLVVVARTGIGGLARYLPFPVLAGFLSGTGYLLLTGGLSTATGVAVVLQDPDTWVLGPNPRVTLVGLALGLLLVVVGRVAPPAALAITVVGAMVVLNIGLRLTGVDLDGGWLLPVDGSGGFTIALLELGEADWGAVLGQLPTILSVVVLTVLALLLNLGALELDTERDVDLDRDLAGSGLANALVALLGGSPGFVTISVSRLSRRVGGLHRSIPVMMAGAVAVALVAGEAFVGLVPVPVVVAVLVFLGTDFLLDWAVLSRKRLTRPEFVIVWGILATIAVLGFLPGIGLGVLATVVVFAVSYARGDAVRLDVDLAAFRSRTDRPDGELEVLRRHGAEAHVLELQGFVFFGSATRIVDRVRSRVQDPDLPPLEVLVLDVGRVVGLDSSALVSIGRVRQLLDQRGAALVLSGVRPRTSRLVDAEHGDLLLADLDRAVQHCEDALLARHEHAAVSPSFTSVLVGELGEAAGTRVRALLDEVHVAAGEAVVTDGAPADELFVLASGTCSVLAEGAGRVRLRTFLPGSLVGEIGLLLRIPRTATVVAEEDCDLLRLTRTALEQLRRDDPDVAVGLHELLGRQLAQRLTDTTRMVEALLTDPGAAPPDAAAGREGHPPRSLEGAAHGT